MKDQCNWCYCSGMTIVKLAPVIAHGAYPGGFDVDLWPALQWPDGDGAGNGGLYASAVPLARLKHFANSSPFKEKKMKTVTYSVPGIGCGGCVAIIQTKLRALNGVQSVKVHLAAKQVEVAFDSSASEDKIKSLLAELYFPVAG